jgi:hypothetical protein
MKTKLLYCLFFVFGLLAMSSLNALAQQYRPYGDNIFCWNADVFADPRTNTVQLSRINFVGTGGIKVNATQTAHDRFYVCVDGSAISANGGNVAGATGGAFGGNTSVPVQVDADFNAATSGTYFVAKTATCTMPSAVGTAGKEVLVWNVCPSGGVVTYRTTQGQTISGAPSGAVNNATVPKLDRFMSDGSNWYRE